jgi:acetyltransferase-like isoleucine patch superfamily enzyme
VKIFSFTNLYGREIRDDVKIGTFVEGQRGAKIGHRFKISSRAFICEGVVLEDEGFVGHGVTFTNDLHPRSTTRGGRVQTDEDWCCPATLVRRRASIRSGATLVGGITIGEEAIIGAGAVVTRDVPSRTVVAGNPAREIRMLQQDE